MGAQSRRDNKTGAWMMQRGKGIGKTQESPQSRSIVPYEL